MSDPEFVGRLAAAFENRSVTEPQSSVSIGTPGWEAIQAGLRIDQLGTDFLSGTTADDWAGQSARSVVTPGW